MTIIDSHSLPEYSPRPDEPKIVDVGVESLNPSRPELDTDKTFDEIVAGLGSAALDPGPLQEMMAKYNSRHPINDYQRSIYSPDSLGF